MTRAALKEATVTDVLLKSRRRCAMCFGLKRDTEMKSGQIAHLDRKNTNAEEDNLAFLCLDHHDEYDSQTSQRKGFTINEVKAFRSELYEVLGAVLKMPVHFGSITLPAADPYAGTYIRLGTTNASAEISLTPLSDNLEGSPRYAVTGYALWGEDREYGPNIGDFDFIAPLNDGVIEYQRIMHDGEIYSLQLSLKNSKMSVKEENVIGLYGMNVFFNGEYEKA